MPDPEPAPPPAPTTATNDDLREAVGVERREKPKKAEPAPERIADEPDEPDDVDDEEAPKKKRKLALVIAIALIAGGTIATLVLLGDSNHGRFVFHCGSAKITAERGNSFPPWGTDRMGGAEWKPIDIPPDYQCKTQETSSSAELAGWYLHALKDQAMAKLQAKEPSEIDDAEAEIDQALLLARDPDKADDRKDLDRLKGDVEYWHGNAKIKAAIQTLEEAGKRFDAAVDKRPQFARDAAAWAGWARQVAGDLRTGPGGAKPDTTAPPPAPDTHTPPPTGVALPVEEGEPDAGVAPVAPVDAGVPRGGVLL